jgi:hypothetical protein
MFIIFFFDFFNALGLKIFLRPLSKSLLSQQVTTAQAVEGARVTARTSF